jgi:UPF0716 protein FxsA
MGLLLLAALIGVPLLEIAVFIQAGEWIGLWPTLGVVILTAILGTWQLRIQGLATLARARHEMDRGTLPARELFDGACLLVAGALLLTPGFVTDAVGFLLFVPAVRGLLRQTLGRRLAARMETRVYVAGGPPRSGPDGPGPAGRGPGGRGPAGRGPRGRRGGPVIEGEYDDVSEEVFK